MVGSRGTPQTNTRISKEKYDVLSANYQDKIERERERKIELARLADFGQKYLRLLDDWNKNENRKQFILSFKSRFA